MNAQTVSGAAKELGGKAQAAVADAIGDGGSELEGRFRQVEGAAQSALGEAKKAVQAAAEDAGEFAEHAYRRGDRAVRGAARLVEARADEAPVAAFAVVAVISFALGFALRAATAD